jgi:putative membrane protein
MNMLTRRTILFAVPGAAATYVSTYASLALAVDALPDARFVGFAQAVNDFDISSGQLALARSTNENIRGYANRAIAEATTSAQALSKSRQEAGVSYAPDGSMGPKTTNLLAQLNSLQGPAFDTAFANAQLSVQTDAEAQYGAYSQNGKSGPLRRFAQEALPKKKTQLEYARRIAGGR